MLHRNNVIHLKNLFFKKKKNCTEMHRNSAKLKGSFRCEQFSSFVKKQNKKKTYTHFKSMLYRNDVIVFKNK